MSHLRMAFAAWALLAAAQAGATEQTCAPAVRAALVPAKVQALDAESGGVIAEACKVWPADPRATLAVLAWPEAGSAAEPGERKVHREVAVLRGGKVVARHGDVVEEDAVTEFSATSLTLDTARYDLAPGRRAFGVVFDSSARGPSCPDAGTGKEMTLFLQEGARLRPVLVTFLSRWRYAPGSGCAMSTTQSHDIDTETVTLKILPTRSRGFADIQRNTSTRREREDGTAGKPKLRSQVLRYDGRDYGLDPYKALQDEQP